MKNTGKSRRPGGRAGAVRKASRGRNVGSGGQGKQALEGKGPTPKAEDRAWHPAGKAKVARERFDAGGAGRAGSATSTRGAGPAHGGSRRSTRAEESEVVTGRNSVLEALRVGIPAVRLYLAAHIETDDRVREVLSLATKRSIPIVEVMRPELDRMAGFGAVHQGLALNVPAYEYAHPIDVLDQALSLGDTPLFIALDGITDPRNLGAIVRSAGAFGAHGVIVPQRRSVRVTAAAWKTSAGAVARVPVAMATNLTQTLKSYKRRGVFVIGLDRLGAVPLPALDCARNSLLVVVGSEGKGLSRLVTETCDELVSIPIGAATESLNAGIAASVTLYEISRRRSTR